MSKLAKILKARANAWAAQRQEEIARSDLHDDLLDSGIHAAPEGFVGAKRAAENDLDHEVDGAAREPSLEPFVQQVTLVVYGWHNVQPGPLSWVFPSARQAVEAAKAMRNAVCWAIVRGRQSAASLDEARKRGNVLLEHAG